MKKIGKILMILVAIITLSGCGAKKAINGNEFMATLGNYKFTINDATADLSNDKIESLLAANNNKYQIEFHVYKSDEYAKQAFNEAKKTFKNTATKKSKEKYKSGGSYDRYTIELDEEYKVVSRIDNTMIYTSVSLEYKKDLDKMLRKLGY